MPAHVHLTHEYAHSADAVWAVAIDPAAYLEVMKGIMTFEGMSLDPLEQGKQIDVTFRLLGKLPPQPYHMMLEVLDHENRTFTSREWGGAVKLWQHKLRVERTETGARLIDDVTIDAGLLTPIYGAFARFMYRRRHPIRLKLLNEKKMETA